MTAITLWLHAHGPMAVALALFVGGFAGVLVMAVLVSGRDRTVRWQTRSAEDAREVDRVIAEWIRAGRDA